jgi:hydrogenase maturation protein HypF
VPLLRSLIEDRLRGRPIAEIARRVQSGLARGTADAVMAVCQTQGLDSVVLSGGVFQNELLLEDFKGTLRNQSITVWTNRAVPPNDGGISLGQAALATFAAFDRANPAAT